jgi:hypothetical protein
MVVRSGLEQLNVSAFSERWAVPRDLNDLLVVVREVIWIDPNLMHSGMSTVCGESLHSQAQPMVVGLRLIEKLQEAKDEEYASLVKTVIEIPARGNEEYTQIDDTGTVSQLFPVINPCPGITGMVPVSSQLQWYH